MPTEACGDGGDEDGGDEGGGVGSGVEEAGGKGSLFGGEPLGGGLDGGGEVAGLAEAEEDAGDAEACDAADKGVADGGAAPDEDGYGVSGLGAEFVDDAAGEEKSYCIGDLEADEDASVVEVIGDLMGVVEAWDPTHEGQVEERLDEGEDRAVHVIDGGGEEEERTDEPSGTGVLWGFAGETNVGETGGLG